MIEGLLRHYSDTEIKKNFVDTHGQSEIAFAFCHLLNFSLMPRLKNINKQKLYLPDIKMKSDLKNIKAVLVSAIDWKIIEEQYDEMVKYATTLKLGYSDTETVMRRFTKNNMKNPTYKAFKELGRVLKTIFLCDYISSEEIRIEVGSGMNVVENWNSANDFIFYGRNSEIQTNNIDDQEISALSLHLLQNSLIYINTIIIQNILSKKKWSDLMKPEDYRALTPLIYLHINPYGNFYLDMKDRLNIAA